MYEVSAYKIPEGYTMNEFAIKLCKDIRNDIDKEDAMDKLFRMSYPIMLTELKKYKNFGPIDELSPDLSLAFMRTIDKFDPDNTNASFINYYKQVLKTNILNSYYGKYKNNEESKNLKRNFENTIGSLDDPLFNKDGIETNSWYDVIEDKNTNIEEEILANDYKYTIQRIINKIFDKKGKGRNEKCARPKAVFTDYVDSILDDEGLTQVDLSKKYGIGRSGINKTITTYMPRFIAELENNN